MPDLVGRVLDALELEAVDVVGASIGNVWALLLGERRPARLRRIVLLGGGPLGQRSPRRRSSSYGAHALHADDASRARHGRAIVGPDGFRPGLTFDVGRRVHGFLSA